jgi:hypothetical protein
MFFFEAPAMRCSFVIGLTLFATICLAKPISSAAGLELGGNGTMLLSDPSIGAFGLGAGFQGSAFFTIWRDNPYAGKFRVETLSLREESVQKTNTDYLLLGSSLKAMGQSWTLMSFGVEKMFQAQGQSFFWEALLGYAFGAGSTVTVTQSTPDSGLYDTNQTTASGFVLSGGIGIKRVFSPIVTGLMSVRTMFLLGAPYSSLPLANKSYFPVPILFNVGAEFPFDIAK